MFNNIGSQGDSFSSALCLLKMAHGKTTYEWDTDDIRVHTSDTGMTYEYIRVTYGWHTVTYEWHTDDIQVHIDKIWAPANDMRMT